jgi:antitoxin PrlF
MVQQQPEGYQSGLTWRKSALAMLLAMAVTPYRVTPARIGNSSGLRLPAAFYRDHPQFAGAAGQVEVLSDDTLLLRLESQDQQDSEVEEESLMLGLFLDFLSRQALTAEGGPVPYTEAMAAQDEELLAGVTVDAADQTGGA